MKRNYGIGGVVEALVAAERVLVGGPAFKVDWLVVGNVVAYHAVYNNPPTAATLPKVVVAHALVVQDIERVAGIGVLLAVNGRKDVDVAVRARAGFVSIDVDVHGAIQVVGPGALHVAGEAVINELAAGAFERLSVIEHAVFGEAPVTKLVVDAVDALDVVEELVANLLDRGKAVEFGRDLCERVFDIAAFVGASGVCDRQSGCTDARKGRGLYQVAPLNVLHGVFPLSGLRVCVFLRADPVCYAPSSCSMMVFAASRPLV